MKAVAIAVALALLITDSATADESSAWQAVDDAADAAESAAYSLKMADDGYLFAVGDTFDLSLQYMDGLVNGGKSRDGQIEAMLDSAFSTMDGVLQLDGDAADNFLSTFESLKNAGAALEIEEFQDAEDDANSAEQAALDAADNVDFYLQDLMNLDMANGELATAIDEWLNGDGMGGMGCP